MDLNKLSQILTGKFIDNIIASPDSMVLIGKADRGPSLIPIHATSFEKVARTFGESSELANAYLEASAITSVPIYLMKYSGQYASVTLDGAITLYTKEARGEMNSANYVVDTFSGQYMMVLEDPATGTERHYLLSGKTAKELEEEINKHASEGRSGVWADAIDYDFMVENLTPVTSKTMFNKGLGYHDFHPMNPVTRETITECLHLLLEAPVKQVGILSGNSTDPVKPTEIEPYPNEALKMLHREIILFLDERKKLGKPCFLTMGAEYTPENGDYSNEADIVGYKILYHSYMMSQESGHEFLNFIAARYRVSSCPTEYRSNGVASYCAMIANLPLGESLAGKVIPGAYDNIFKLRDDKITRLASQGYVLPSESPLKEMRVYKSISLLHKDGATMLSYTSNANIVLEVMKALHPILDSYIGTKKSMRDLKPRLEKALSTFPKEILQGYEVEVETSLEAYGAVKRYIADGRLINPSFGRFIFVNLQLIIPGEVDILRVTLSA